MYDYHQSKIDLISLYNGRDLSSNQMRIFINTK